LPSISNTKPLYLGAVFRGHAGTNRQTANKTKQATLKYKKTDIY